MVKNFDVEAATANLKPKTEAAYKEKVLALLWRVRNEHFALASGRRSYGGITERSIDRHSAKYEVLDQIIQEIGKL